MYEDGAGRGLDCGRGGNIITHYYPSSGRVLGFSGMYSLKRQTAVISGPKNASYFQKLKWIWPFPCLVVVVRTSILASEFA